MDTKETFDDFLTITGGEVKALENGKVAGYLVRFSSETDPDLAGDYFTPDTDFGPHKVSPMLYNHGLDVRIGGKIIGAGQMKIDDVGVWIEAQLELRDKYEKAIYNLARKGKLGWSSGTASHLVMREKKTNGAARITSWPLGLDASLTPTPAEPRNAAVAIKSIQQTDISEQEVSGDDTAEEVANTETKTKGETMAEEVKKTEEASEEKPEVKTDLMSEVLGKVSAEIEQKNQQAAEEAKKKAEIEESVKSLVEAAMRAAPASNGGMKANINTKTQRGDDAVKAFNHFIKTGDAGGIRADVAYKTDYNLVEGTQYQGQELVPTEIAARIFEKRDPMSIARAAGSNILQVNSSAVNVPYEKTRQGVFVAPGEATAYDQLEQQIFDKLAVTITKYTRNVPISEELLEDSVVDLVPYIVNNAARALALTENKHFITNATGAWYGSTKGLDFDSATAIGVAEPIELLHSLNAEYRDNLVWLSTKATEAYVRSLNSAYSFPYMGNGGASGFMGAGGGTAPNSFLGGRYFNDENIDALAAGKKSLFVGNFQAGYVICERRALTVRRDESSMSSGLIKILFSTRIGGGIVNSEALVHGLHPTA